MLSIPPAASHVHFLKLNLLSSLQLKSLHGNDKIVMQLGDIGGGIATKLLNALKCQCFPIHAVTWSMLCVSHEMMAVAPEG